MPKKRKKRPQQPAAATRAVRPEPELTEPSETSEASGEPLMPWLEGRPLVAIVAVALAVATAAIYAPVRSHLFVALDDPMYIAENPHLLGGLTWSNIVWAFTTGYAANWHPLTWLSHLVDVTLYGLNPAGHHLTNVAFHVVNTVLVFLVLLRLTKSDDDRSRLWRCAFVAAIFAVHPLHVESVAWASERKDVLSTCFGLAAIWAYAGYVATPDWRRYALVCACFAFALMAKPMLITLPLVLLLLDFWPLSRPMTARLWVEKIPMFVMAAASSVVTLAVQRTGGALGGNDSLPWMERAGNIAVSYVAYLRKTLWPVDLAAFYPYRANVPAWQIAAAASLIAVVSALAIQQRRRRPYLFVGWFWYLVMLLPVIGIVQAGIQSMADRYMYLPLIGPSIVAAWGLPALADRWPDVRRSLPAAAGVVLFACTLVTEQQLTYWQDSVALWQRVARVTLGQDDQQAQDTVVAMLRSRGREAEISEHFGRTGGAPGSAPMMRADSYSAEWHYDEGITLAQQGKFNEAIDAFSAALALKPDYLEAMTHLGMALAAAGRTDEAIARDEEALRLAPDQAVVHSNLGALLAGRGRTAEALEHFKDAVRLQPTLAEAQDNLGLALAQQDRVDEAAAHFAEAVRLRPDMVAAHVHLGIAFAKQDKIEDAKRELTTALRLDPKNQEARATLDAIK